MINFKKDFEDSFFKEDVKTYDPIVKNVNGSRVIVLEERVKDLNEGLKATDFDVQSLLDADAFDLLQPTAPISRDSLTVVDIANNIASNLGNTLDNVNVNVEPTKTEEK